MALDEKKLRVSSIASTVYRRCEYRFAGALTRRSASSLSESMAVIPPFVNRWRSAACIGKAKPNPSSSISFQRQKL